MKKQILLCTVSPIFPIASGGKIYTANMILPIADEYDYHLVSFIREHDKREIEQYKEEYAKYFKSCSFVDRPIIPCEKSKLGKLIHFAEHYIKRLPLMDISFYSHEAVKTVKELISKYHIDILELHNLHTAYLKKEFPNIPTLLVNQNIEGDIFPFWEPVTNKKLNKIFWKWIAKESRKNTYDVEIDNLYKFEVKSFISKIDMNRANKGKCKYYHLPLAFDSIPNIKTKKDGIFRVVWMGGFLWYPNAEGIEWFVDYIYPLLKGANNIEIHFVGGNPPEKLLGINDGKQFFVHGWVENKDAILGQSDLMMVPLLSGGGIRVKIVEALSIGIPVLSTSKGCEGLGVQNGKDIFVRDDPAEFAKAILSLSKANDELEKISTNGIQYINKHHNMKVCLDLKRDIYKILSAKE